MTGGAHGAPSPAQHTFHQPAGQFGAWSGSHGQAPPSWTAQPSSQRVGSCPGGHGSATSGAASAGPASCPPPEADDVAADVLAAPPLPAAEVAVSWVATVVEQAASARSAARFRVFMRPV